MRLRSLLALVLALAFATPALAGDTFGPVHAPTISFSNTTIKDVAQVSVSSSVASQTCTGGGGAGNPPASLCLYDQTVFVTSTANFPAYPNLKIRLRLGGNEVDPISTVTTPNGDGTYTTVAEAWFFNIAPGTYTAKVRAARKSGVPTQTYTAGQVLWHVTAETNLPLP